MDTFQVNPKEMGADMVFHHPHDMQTICHMHNLKIPTGLQTPWRNRVEIGCTIEHEITLGFCGHSFQEYGPDHSCPVDGQGGGRD